MRAVVFINAVVFPESAETLCCNIGRQAAIDRVALRMINRPAAQLEVKLVEDRDVHIAAPDSCRILRTADGRLARPAHAVAAQWVAITWAAVLSATETVPRMTKCRATSAAGSINAG